MAWRYSLSLVLKLCLNIEKVLRDCVFFRLILLLLPSGAPLSSISLIVMHSVGLPLRTSAHRWIPSTISLRKCPVIYLRSSWFPCCLKLRSRWLSVHACSSFCLHIFTVRYPPPSLSCLFCVAVIRSDVFFFCSQLSPLTLPIVYQFPKAVEAHYALDIPPPAPLKLWWWDCRHFLYRWQYVSIVLVCVHPSAPLSTRLDLFCSQGRLCVFRFVFAIVFKVSHFIFPKPYLGNYILHGMFLVTASCALSSQSFTSGVKPNPSQLPQLPTKIHRWKFGDTNVLSERSRVHSSHSIMTRPMTSITQTCQYKLRWGGRCQDNIWFNSDNRATMECRYRRWI